MPSRVASRLMGPVLVAASIAGAVALADPGETGARRGDPGRITFGHSVKGTALRAVRLGDPNAKRKVLVVGVIHGDEPAGLKVIRALRRSHSDIKGVQLWVVKAVNPDGLAANMRKNAHGVDLNRNFSFH